MTDPKFVAAACAHAVLAVLSLDDLEWGAEDEAFHALAPWGDPIAAPTAADGATSHRASRNSRPEICH